MAGSVHSFEAYRGVQGLKEPGASGSSSNRAAQCQLQGFRQDAWPLRKVDNAMYVLCTQAGIQDWDRSVNDKFSAGIHACI